MTKRRERGAALLDVVIALAITGLLAAALTQTARFGLDVTDRARAASASSAEMLAAKRRVSDLLTRIDAGTPDRPSAKGDEATFIWRGPAPDGDGWNGGVWKLATTEDGAAISSCESFDAEACETIAETPLTGPFAYTGRDGEEVETWAEGGPPVLIRIGDVIIHPRLTGAGG